MPDDRARIAHVLRRTTFGPFPGMPEDLARRGVQATVDTVLAAAPLEPPVPVFDEDADNNANGPAWQWLRLMANPEAGVHEKMVWFWHGHLTSSHDKVATWDLMWRQHLLLRRHALGNFRELLRAVTVDGAMLQYLDGDGSSAASPNENFGRELMELFALGRGNYTQHDVRAAATALSGWTVDDDGGAPRFDPSSGNGRPVALLGRQVVDARDVVDVVCDHPACARFIAAKMHRYLVGIDPSPDRVGELAAVFARANLEILPLVEAIVGHRDFLAATFTRARYPVEWVTAALGVCGIDDAGLAYDTMTALGQSPFYPPNVAGWPPGIRWVSPSCAVARAALAVGAPAIPEIAAAADPVIAAFERAAIYDPSIAALAAARGLADRLSRHNRETRAAAVVALVLSTPEFALA
jgi:uncharacterized protein (DUF1800 family)